MTRARVRRWAPELGLGGKGGAGEGREPPSPPKAAASGVQTEGLAVGVWFEDHVREAAKRVRAAEIRLPWMYVTAELAHTSLSGWLWFPCLCDGSMIV